MSFINDRERNRLSDFVSWLSCGSSASSNKVQHLGHPRGYQYQYSLHVGLLYCSPLLLLLNVSAVWPISHLVCDATVCLTVGGRAAFRALQGGRAINVVFPHAFRSPPQVGGRQAAQTRAVGSTRGHTTNGRRATRGV